jgi:hypothetical protein
MDRVYKAGFLLSDRSRQNIPTYLSITSLIYNGSWVFDGDSGYFLALRLALLLLGLVVIDFRILSVRIVGVRGLAFLSHRWALREGSQFLQPSQHCWAFPQHSPGC